MNRCDQVRGVNRCDQIWGCEQVRGHNLETGHTLHTPDHNGRGKAPSIYALLWKGQSEAVHVGLWEASVGPQLLAAGQRQGIVRGRSPLTELTSARRALRQLVLYTINLI